ncbi:hypothetical protein [Croceimicrobium hydrocarbonivorans]|uniref:Uncharacterized protein n=1 Tax=Croceimicrobium hydrocarbonivorans TaxID=2761580 RepID=A0A7H0VB70_9FLAO|nr:hypothetical protein [Croceimicrobium hydrocarbonivorans]QNR22968.1 hypothetical protein H4K34_11320 [Croceimicrobium hydrocarbonivorans]QNR23013.1 hypothetical protein H4K34_11545 [Croceimicrobium hydrocarbonivorans]
MNIDVKIYSIAYPNLQDLTAALKAKGVLNEAGQYAAQTHSVVILNHVPVQRAQYDQQGNLTQQEILSPLTHADVMSENLNLDFGNNISELNALFHSF